MKIFRSAWRTAKEESEIERHRYAEEDQQLHEEIETAIGSLPDWPARSGVERVLRAQRKEYVVYAHRNAIRLDRAYAQLARFIQIVTIIGAIFAITQLVLGVIAVDLFSGQRQTLTTAQEGRRVSLTVICAVESAVAETGRIVIAGPSKPPPVKRERALERLGFPPFGVRHRQQERVAKAYVRSISKAVDKALGSTGHHARPANRLVLPSGRLNCLRLTQIAHTG